MLNPWFIELDLNVEFCGRVCTLHGGLGTGEADDNFLNRWRQSKVRHLTIDANTVKPPRPSSYLW
jgi:hypothetical protein